MSYELGPEDDFLNCEDGFTEMQRLHEGMGILLTVPCEDGSLSATHDELFLPGAHPECFTEEQRLRLHSLGFIYHDDLDSWSIFT